MGETEARNQETYCLSKAPNHFRLELADRSGRIPRVGDTEPEKPRAWSEVVLGLSLKPRAAGSPDPGFSPASARAAPNLFPERTPPGAVGRARPTSLPIKTRERGVPLPVGLTIDQ